MDLALVRRVLVLVIVIAACSVKSFACFCGGGGPICNSYWTTDAVFVGRVLDIQAKIVEIITVPGKSMQVPEAYLVTFAISEVFRGVTGKQVIVQTGTGGGDCGYKFQKGKNYVVFARGTPLSTSICSNTMPVDEFPGGIEALRAVAHAPLGGKLSGTVRQEKPDSKDTYSPESALKGVEVVAKGPESRSAITDQSGQYTFSSLPGGEYTVTVTPPGHLTAPAKTISVPERGCAVADVYVVPSTAIRGRILGSDGRGISGVGVEAIAWDSRNGIDLRSSGMAVSNQAGDYEISSLFPGTYMLVASFSYDVGYDRPAYRMKFYPDSDWREQASSITIAEGDQVDGIDFTLEGPLASKRVKVEVEWPNGTPVEKGLVSYAPSNHPFNPFYPPHLDQHGSAEIELLDHTVYLVCAAGVSADGSHFRSQTVVLNTSSGPRNLKLILDTPGIGECPGWRELAGTH